VYESGLRRWTRCDQRLGRNSSKSDPDEAVAHGQQAILRQCQLQPKKHVELPEPNQQPRSFSVISCSLLYLPAVSILWRN
jgi:hypothetical protein